MNDRHARVCGIVGVLVGAGGVVVSTCALRAARGAEDIVERDQSRRIELVERITPAGVCIYDGNKRGGGSGVLIDPDGYGVTNYHVVAKLLENRRGWGGLGDGELYEMEVLGIDPTGDVAMFRLLDEQRFPSVQLGDSDAARVGDPVVVLGDPFVLSEDNMPTVTSGIITGAHRYQGGTKGNLIYSDCLQTDASINPGNSGGPLFNDRGEVIGINGRISVGERGRFNVGHGYAISSNQVRRFVPALRAGLLARHGSLHATVRERDDGAVEFDEIALHSPAKEAGFRAGDRLVSIDGVDVASANHYISLMGTFPEDWPLTVVARRGSQRVEKVVRLAPLEPNIRFEYVADRQANIRQVRRVLDRFRRALGPDPSAGSKARAMVWTVVARGDGALLPDGTGGERLRIVQTAGQAARLERIADTGAETVCTFDEVWAEKPDGELLLPERQMVFNTLYVLQALLVPSADGADLGDLEHAGADAPFFQSGAAGEDAARVTVWEVLSRQTPGGLTIKLSFDPATGLPRRVRAFDPASDHRVSIELRDHRRFGEATWPATLDVDGEGSRFSWEVQSVERLP